MQQKAKAAGLQPGEAQERNIFGGGKQLVMEIPNYKIGNFVYMARLMMTGEGQTLGKVIISDDGQGSVALRFAELSKLLTERYGTPTYTGRTPFGPQSAWVTKEARITLSMAVIGGDPTSTAINYEAPEGAGSSKL